jgi:hypothetical protein
VSRYREVLLKVISACAVLLLVSFGLCGISVLAPDTRQQFPSTFFLVSGIIGYFGIFTSVLGFIITCLLLVLTAERRPGRRR